MKTLRKFDMSGKVSIITGGAQGLGKAMATALAEAGSDIVIAEINVPLAQETARRLEADCGIRTLVVRCDVTSPADAEQLAKETVGAFGKIDVLVNNAGICINTKAESVTPEEWLKVININLNGVFFCSQAVGRVMIEQKSGSIINISSMSGLIVNTPQPQASYNASKAAVIHLTKSLAAEWAEHRIRVNTIAPGYMLTEMTRPTFENRKEWSDRWTSLIPMSRPGNPDELGGIVVYLASDASSYATGGVFTVDGGYTVW